jgi:Domain of unknown function (DUF4372)
MNSGRYILSQVLDLVDRKTLSRLVERHDAESRVRHFGARQQLICMAFAQLTWREGLRDIATCLNAKPEALYHLGFREPVAKSTLADANEQRDWRWWEDLAKKLMGQARTLYAGEDLGLELENTVYALDSTTIDLSLTLFPWADFRSTKAGIKMHTQLDLRGPIPTCIYITNYVQLTADNDLPTMLSSGFLVNSNSRTQSPLDTPNIVSIDNGMTTQLIVRGQGVDNARWYEAQVKNGTGGWTPAGTFTQSRRIVLADSPPAKSMRCKSAESAAAWATPIGATPSPT